MTGWLNRSREAERRRKRRWQMLGLLLLALAVALYWIDRKMTGRPGGHLGEWIPVPVPGRDGHPAAEGTAPAGAEPMAGASAGSSTGTEGEAVGAVDVAEPSAETITTAPPVEAAETGQAPEPPEWQEALEGQAPDEAASTETEESGNEVITAEEPATGGEEPDVTPSIAAGWVEGDGTNVCPEAYPIKGNVTSHIFHRPGESSYEVTIADICFATEEDARSGGYRPRKR
ncbi:MAG: hypothetical protein ACRDJW_10185 [Thermomicrobiales bacterium]